MRVYLAVYGLFEFLKFTGLHIFLMYSSLVYIGLTVVEIITGSAIPEDASIIALVYTLGFMVAILSIIVFMGNIFKAIMGAPFTSTGIFKGPHKLIKATGLHVVALYAVVAFTTSLFMPIDNILLPGLVISLFISLGIGLRNLYKHTIGNKEGNKHKLLKQGKNKQKDQRKAFIPFMRKKTINESASVNDTTEQNLNVANDTIKTTEHEKNQTTPDKTLEQNTTKTDTPLSEASASVDPHTSTFENSQNVTANAFAATSSSPPNMPKAFNWSMFFTWPTVLWVFGAFAFVVFPTMFFMGGPTTPAAITPTTINPAGFTPAANPTPKGFAHFGPMTEEELAMGFAERAQQLDAQANAEIESLQNNTEYDDVVFTFSGDETSVFTNPQNLAVLSSVYQGHGFIEDIMQTFDMIHDMSFDIATQEETFTETVEKTDADGNTYFEEVEKTRSTNNLATNNFEELMTLLDFSEDQKDMARLMAENEPNSPFSDSDSPVFLGSDYLTPEEIEEVLKDAPSIPITREELVNQALTLDGHTNYSLGAKARASNETPDYLDCSGFVAWTYEAAGATSVLQGGGTGYQWGKTFPISEDDLLPGDLAFMQKPHTVQPGNFNHNGIYIGQDENGQNLFIHSVYPTGVTVDNGTMFEYFRRVPVNFAE